MASAWLSGFREREREREMTSEVVAEGSSDYLSLVITSSLSSFGSQRRFPASITVGELKVGRSK